MDIRAMKRRLRRRVCLLGNVDLNILGMGTPEEVDQEVYELIRDVGPGGGYILTSGNSLASYLNPECVFAMAEAVRNTGAIRSNSPEAGPWDRGGHGSHRTQEHQPVIVLASARGNGACAERTRVWEPWERSERDNLAAISVSLRAYVQDCL